MVEDFVLLIFGLVLSCFVLSFICLSLGLKTSGFCRSGSGVVGIGDIRIFTFKCKFVGLPNDHFLGVEHLQLASFVFLAYIISSRFWVYGIWDVLHSLLNGNIPPYIPLDMTTMINIKSSLRLPYSNC